MTKTSTKRATSAKPKKPSLARPGDPYVCADGRVISAERAHVFEGESVSDTLSVAEFRPIATRGIKDLAAEPNFMRAVACVIVFTLMGLSDREVAESLNISVEAVEKVKDHEAYEDTFNALAAEFINANSNLIEARIAAYQHPALTSVANVAVNGKQEGNRLRAGLGLLDLGGHSKKSAGRGLSDGDVLRIVVSEGDKAVEVEMSIGEGV